MKKIVIVHDNKGGDPLPLRTKLLCDQLAQRLQNEFEVEARTVNINEWDESRDGNVNLVIFWGGWSSTSRSHMATQLIRQYKAVIQDRPGRHMLGATTYFTNDQYDVVIWPNLVVQDVTFYATSFFSQDLRDVRFNNTSKLIPAIRDAIDLQGRRSPPPGGHRVVSSSTSNPILTPLVVPPAPAGSHVQKVKRFEMAKFWDVLEQQAPYFRIEGGRAVDKAPETRLSQRVTSACRIMLPSISDVQRGAVVNIIVNRLTDHAKNNAEVPNTEAGRADFYIAKALISKTPAAFQESGKRALAAVGALLVAGGVAGAPIGIGVKIGNDAALAAVDALNAIAKDGGKMLLDQLHASNPYLIAIIAGITLGILAIPTAAIGGGEAIETVIGRRSAARNLERVVEEAMNAHLRNAR